MAYQMVPPIKTLRHLLSEIRRASSSGKLRDSHLTSYIFSQYKKFRTTSQQVCRATEEMSCIVNGYVTYLQSNRKHTDLLKMYHNGKERTVEEAAKLFGFKLPHDHKP